MDFRVARIVSRTSRSCSLEAELGKLLAAGGCYEEFVKFHFRAFDLLLKGL